MLWLRWLLLKKRVVMCAVEIQPTRKKNMWMPKWITAKVWKKMPNHFRVILIWAMPCIVKKNMPKQLNSFKLLPHWLVTIKDVWLLHTTISVIRYCNLVSLLKVSMPTNKLYATTQTTTIRVIIWCMLSKC